MFDTKQKKAFFLGLIIALLLGWLFAGDEDSKKASIEEVEEEERITVSEIEAESSFGFIENTPDTVFTFTQPKPQVVPEIEVKPAPQVAGLTTSETEVEPETQIETETTNNRRRGGSNNNSSSEQNNPETNVETNSTSTETGTNSTSTETGGGTPATPSNPEAGINIVTEEQAAKLAASASCDPLDVLPLKNGIFSFVPTNAFADLGLSGTSTTERGYEVRTCGNVSLYIQWENNLPVRTLVLIEGNINPLSSGPWSDLSGSTITDTILYSVSTGADKSSLTANTFPAILEAAINRTYGGSLSLKAGQHATAGLNMEGVMKEVLDSMGYPTSDLTILAGQALPPVSVQTGAAAAVGSTKKKTSFSDGLKPTYFVELAHRGTWSNAAGIKDLALVDSTVYYDNSNNFGFWGVGTFKNTQFATFYNGPFLKSKDPRDYLAAQIGFGAESMTLPRYLEFVYAYNNRYQYLAADATGISAAADTTYDALSVSLNAIPLDVVSVDHSELKSLVYNSGDAFPGLQYFNSAVIGPLGTTKNGTNGPQATIFGEGKLFKSTMGTIDFSMTASSAAASMTGSVGIDLGSAGGYSLGTLGGDSTLNVSATEQAQSMTLAGSFAAGPFGGQGITLDFNPSKINFARAANCALPLSVTGYTNLVNASSMTLSDLIFVPTVAIPDPTVLINCPEDIFFMAKDGVVLAFNGTVKLMEFADSFLPENEFTKIGIDGFKFAGGTLINAPEELLDLSKNVPGVSEALDAAADAKKAAEDAAAAAAAEAERLAQEAAAEASRLAAAAVGAALDFTNDFLSDPAGTLGDVFGAIGGAVEDFFDGGSSGPTGFSDWIDRTNNHAPARAKDISLSHGNVDWAWAVNLDGDALQFERAPGNGGYWWIRANGLPNDYGGFVHIDADPNGGAVGITTKGEIYTRTINGNWNKANGSAVDVGIGGGYIWVTSTQIDGGGFRIYRSTYYSGQTNFAWQDMYGSGIRIDVGGDGDAWTVNNSYRVYENTAGGWHDRRGVALDIAVSNGGTAWIVGTNISHYGGQIHVYIPPKYSPLVGAVFPGWWEPTAGHAITIGAGAGPRVWAVNSFDNIYEASGRP